MSIPYIAKSDSVTLFIKGRGITVASDHINFKKIVAKLENGDDNPDEFMNLIDLVKSLGAQRAEPEVTSRGKHDVTFDVASGTLKYRGYPLSGYIATKALELHRTGAPKPLLKFLSFLENLYQNPRNSIAERLYKFLEVGNMPLTDDGYFLAYKKVRSDWKDIHSGTMDNSVGKILEMPRVLVNDKDTETCSTGLHFCSYAYLDQFRSKDPATDRIIVLKINPADVVSIPTDYNDTKGRTCKYEVLSEITLEAQAGPVLSQGPAIVSASAFRTVEVNNSAKSVLTPSMHTQPYTADDAAAARAPTVDSAVWPYPVVAGPGYQSINELAPIVQTPSPISSNSFDVSSTVGKLSVSVLTAHLASFSNTQLAAIWNQMGIHQIDHFRDKATGIKRLLALTDRATLERLAGV
jgi:hypothetical protein